MYVDTKEMLRRAYDEHFMVIGAECWSLNSAAALVDTAKQLEMPLIIMLWDGAPRELADMKRICDFVRNEAQRSQVPIAMHLDHAHSIDAVKEAIEAGFSSVMLDASDMPFEENVEATREAVRLAHDAGAAVEAELGHVGGSSGETSDIDSEENKLTRPEEVKAFIEQTNIDSLAVSIGTVHGAYKGEPHLDIPRLKRIYEISQIPLVLHGGSDTGTDRLKQASQYGVCKLNVMTDLIRASAGAVKPGEPFVEIKMYGAIKECLRSYMLALSHRW